MVETIKVGFWKKNRVKGEAVMPWDEDLAYPSPIADSCQRTEEDKRVFLNKLKQVEGNSAKSEAYFGFSRCRICDCSNGSEEYTLKINNRSYVWPSGYTHYLVKHNVAIPDDFYNDIMAYEMTSKSLWSSWKKQIWMASH